MNFVSYSKKSAGNYSGDLQPDRERVTKHPFIFVQGLFVFDTVLRAVLDKFDRSNEDLHLRH